MTLDELISRLPATREGAQWYIMADGRIRGANCCCPATALYPNGPEPTLYAEPIEDVLGLSEDDVFSLVNAADMMEPYSTELRARLLVACGL